VGAQERLLGDVLGPGPVSRQRVGQLDHAPVLAEVEVLEAAGRLQRLVLCAAYRRHLGSGHLIPPPHVRWFDHPAFRTNGQASQV
jgi:hypothetical protein